MGLRKDFRSFIRPGYDPWLFAAILILSFWGLLSLAGVSGFEGVFFKKQLSFFFIGLFLFFAVSSVDYRIFRNYSLPSVLFLIAGFFLLLITLQAVPVRGVTAWLHLPLGLSFETSEVVKLALILFLARYFSSKGFRRGSVAASAIPVFSIIFLVFLQPDFGSAVILFFIWFGGVLFFGLSRRQIMTAAIILLAVSLIASVFFLEPYQKSRIDSFLSGFSGQGEESYNVIQAKIAIGSGGFLGKGFGDGTQAKHGLLPESNSDFAIAALTEQFGFLILTLVLGMYLIILNRLFFIGTRVKDNFSRFFIFLFLIYFFSHVVINIGMNLGLLPVTGLPLPFISYGGSYLLSLMTGFGIVESIRRRNL